MDFTVESYKRALQTVRTNILIPLHYVKQPFISSRRTNATHPILMTDLLWRKWPSLMSGGHLVGITLSHMYVSC